MRFSHTVIAGLVALGTAASAQARQAPQSRTVDLHIKEGTNFATALSPDRGTIALDLLGRIWLIPRAGGTATPLTAPLEESRQPTWSPDGSRIAFQSYRDGTWHIWSIARDGSDVRQHTSGNFDDREPDYTADGKIVFSSDRSGNYDLWQVDPATGAMTQLTNDPGDDQMPAVNRSSGSIAFTSARQPRNAVWVRTPDGQQSVWAQSPGQPNSPAWSIEGAQLSWTDVAGGSSRLMIAMRGGEPRVMSPTGSDAFQFRATWLPTDELLYTGDGQIRVVNMAGAMQPSVPFDARITFTRQPYTKRARDFEGRSASKVLGITGPALSPDGNSVVFTALGDLWKLELPDGGRPTPDVRRLSQLTSDPYVQFDPVWSPDGKQIAYASDKSGTMELWLRDVATNAERALTKAEGGAALPSWTPDGKEVVYQVQRGLGTEIKAVDVASGTTRRVKAGLFGPSRVTFNRDGSVLAVAALRQYSQRYREGRNDILVFDRNGANERWIAPRAGRGITARGEEGPVWSPDGRRMAFVLDGVLFTEPVTPNGDYDGAVTRLTTELANTPTWSGDSRKILYQANDGLRLVDVATGLITKIDVPLTWRQVHPATARRIVVHAARLWDGTSANVRQNVDVVIAGHRIVSVAPHSAHARGDSVVDAGNYTVIPGIADAHAHEGFGVGEGLGRTWLAWGITTVRDPASDPFAMRERREATESGVRVGPRVLSTGRIFDGERIYYNFNNAMTPGAQLQLELERAAALDFSLIKTYVRLPDVLQARIIDFGHANGIPISSHELYPSVAYGGDHVEHISGTSRRGYSPKMSRIARSYGDVVDLLIHGGMSITPTVALQGGYNLVARANPSILDDARLAIAYGPEYVAGLKAAATGGGGGGGGGGGPPGGADIVASEASLVAKVVRGGGLVMAGTDSPIIPFGLGLHVELQNYVESGGLTPREALMTATSNFAKIVGVDRDLGTIAPGKLADLVAVEGNPLEQITDTKRVKVVVKDGEVFTLDQLLKGAISLRRPLTP